MSGAIPDNVLNTAVDRVLAGETIAAVSRDLGIGRHALRRTRGHLLPQSVVTRGKSMGGQTRKAQIPDGTSFREPIFPQDGRY